MKSTRDLAAGTTEMYNLTELETGKSTVKVLADSVSGQDLFSGSYTAPSHCVLT